MYQSFEQYSHKRQKLDFANRFESLCQSIALSGMGFDNYWETHALPTLLNLDAINTEDELMMELERPVLTESWYNPLSWGKGSQSATPSQNVMNRQADIETQRAKTAQMPQDPRWHTNPEHQKKYDAFSQQIQKMTADIKSRFSQAMRSFVQAVSNDAKRENNPHLWKMAQNFQKNVMQAADGFTQKIKIGKGNYHDDFNKERDAMNQQNLANRKTKLNDPNVQAGLDAQRQMKGGASRDEIMAQAQALAKNNPGLSVEKLVGPDGKPTQLGMQYLMPPEEWRAKQQKSPPPIKINKPMPLAQTA